MSDLISRSALIKELDYYISHTNETSGEHYAYKQAKRLVEKQPSVEPVRGEWINDFKPPFFGNKCSVCGYPSGSTSFNFCPYCGSDMRGKKND